MINTLRIYNELKETMDPVAAEKIADAVGLIYEELRYSVTKTEFNELKDVVSDLAEAQKRTEIRLEELAEAQKRTEIRVEQLAQAQARTEIRLEELAEAQLRTEQRLEQLAIGLSRLEKKVEDLVGEMRVFKKELGGLAHTVGYRLEDQAMKSLPALVKRDLSIETQGSLIRDYLEIGPRKYVELNIWGRGLQDGKPVEIIGEAKSQLKKRDVDIFLQTIKTVEPIIDRPIIPIVVTYQTSPDVRQYVKAKGITLYFSYQL